MLPCPVCGAPEALTLIPLVGSLHTDTSWVDYMCQNCDHIITQGEKGEFVFKRINVRRVTGKSKKTTYRGVKKAFLIRRENING